jgi:hypothetical protein
LAPDGLAIGQPTVTETSSMMIRRMVIETLGNDHRTLTRIVVPTVSIRSVKGRRPDGPERAIREQWVRS